MMHQNRRQFLWSAASATLLTGLAGRAAAMVANPDHGFFAEDGVAIRGADPVAYFTDGAPMTGWAEFSHEWAGSTWHFATDANRKAFIADPQAYAPQYGGHCAWAVAEKSELVSVDPEAWAIEDGKLYLNYSRRVQRWWNRDRPAFITAGDQNWPGLKSATL